MNIHGIQKLTLLDYPEKTACTVFTGGCNFRCPFCHNAGLVLDKGRPVMSEQEFFDFLGTRKGKLDGVCITGGEPLIHSEVEDFIKKIKSHGFLVKLDTNGSNPEYLRSLINQNIIDYVAMDIKNSKDKYLVTAGDKNIDIDKINESIKTLINCGIEYEFRTTVVKEFHNAVDIDNVGRWISGAGKYYLQQYKDSGNIIDKTAELHSHSVETMEEFRNIAAKYVKHAEIRGI